MKLIFKLVLLVEVLATPAFAESPAGWGTDYARVVGLAKTNGTPVLVYFTASWCGPCKRMARTTLVDDRVLAALKTVPHVIVDIDEQPVLAEKHAIRAVPTFQVVLPSSVTVESITGFQEPGPFALWISNTLVAASEKLQRDERQTRQLGAVSDALTTGDPAVRAKAALDLLEFAASPSEAIRETAMNRLNSLSAADAKHLLPGLNHPALAVRIRAANCLRAKLGDTFDIDPWAPAETRAKAVQEWGP